MSQSKLKDYQKQLFEYDYTLKKIDNILISTRLPQEEREHYQMSREACLKAKNKTSQEMAEYAKQNRLSLLIAPLSKDEKEELIQSIERGGDSGETIKFDDVREEQFYVEEETFMPEVTTGYKTKKLNEYVMNGTAEIDDNPDVEDLENRVVGNDNLEIDDLDNMDVQNDNLEVDYLDNIDVENDNLEIDGLNNTNVENESIEENDFDFGNEKNFSDDLENESDTMDFNPEVIDFIRSLKRELAIFYGR